MTDLITDLKDPVSYPFTPEKVEVVQTHISIVFIADETVYKVKKPVDFGFLNFSDLEKRHFYCKQELMLNRRLAKGIYLDVVPISLDHGRHTLEGRGEPVEYAVKMKRIPEERLMKSLFDNGCLSHSDLDKVAETLAGFHKNALRSPQIDQFGRAEKFRVNTDENFEQVRKYIDISIRNDDFHALKEWTADFYRDKREMFSRRIDRGKIRDCHGDLHMEHICFTDDLAVIDCIEFNDRFRYSDTIADIAFLLMDLEFHGGVEFSDHLWKQYCRHTGDVGVEDLLVFYKVYRAFVRGKVNSFQLDDDRIGEKEKAAAAQRAHRYFRLARSYI